MQRAKKILVAPLNWGLGHATRCIPIVKELLKQGIEVHLASDGRALELLKKELPELPVLVLPAYGIKYRSKHFLLNLIYSMPRMMWAVYQENARIKKYIELNKIDGLISDNRLGCFYKKIPSVFITHQINLKIPVPFLENISHRINRWFIAKFAECWVPDLEGFPNLSGELSHGTSIKNIKYIGAVSRMKFFKPEKKYDVIAVVSGPEPQRSSFEKKIIEQAKKLSFRFLIVQGITEKRNHFFLSETIKVVSSMTSEILNESILASDLFIGRAGYSSIMDLAKLGKPALLIPTPGQTEQAYLAEKMSADNIFLIQNENDLNLETGIPEALKRNRLSKGFIDEKEMIGAILNFTKKLF